MKITKRQLKRIIREEKRNLVKESAAERSYPLAQKILDESIQRLAHLHGLDEMLDIASAKEDNLMVQLIQAARALRG